MSGKNESEEIYLLARTHESKVAVLNRRIKDLEQEAKSKSIDILTLEREFKAAAGTLRTSELYIKDLESYTKKLDKQNRDLLKGQFGGKFAEIDKEVI